MITTEKHSIEINPDDNPSLLYTGVNVYSTIQDQENYDMKKKLIESSKIFFVFYPNEDQFYIRSADDNGVEARIYNNLSLKHIHLLFRSENALIKYKCMFNDSYQYLYSNTVTISFYMDFSILSQMKPYAYYNDYYSTISRTLLYKNTPQLKMSLLKPAKNQLIETDFNTPFQLNLFDYQKNNIDWMIKLENMYDLNLNNLEIFKNSLKEITVDDNKFYVSNSNLIYDESYLDEISNKERYNLRGGVIHDEVGLGKTFTMLGLIFNTLPNNRKLKFYPKRLTKKQKKSLEEEQTEIYYTNKGKLKSTATLVICPARLCAQWEDELKKYLKPNSDVRMYTISTVINYKKMMENKKLLCNADVIFVSTNIFTNNNYFKACMEQDNFPLDEIYWHRIIFDEGHEVLHTYHHGYRKRSADELLYKEVMSLRSKYKWVCSGTPLPYNGESLDAIISYLTNNEFETEFYYKFTQEQLDEILTKYFRHNTKKSVKDQIYIPKIQEKTIFLKQTPLERTVYENAVGDELRLIQLCTHILVSQTDSEILGHEVKSLDEVQTKMIKHFDKLISKENNDILRRENKIKAKREEYEKADEEYTKYSDEWKEFRQNCKNTIKYHEDKIKLGKDEIEHLKARQSLFTSLNDRIKEISQELCPICYDHIEKVTLTKCSHIFCADCIQEYGKGKKSIECPMCRTVLDTSKDIGYKFAKDETEDKSQQDGSKESEFVLDYNEHINRWGTKMAYLIKFLQIVISQDESHRIIIFSQWKRMLELVGSALEFCGIKNVYLRGNIHVMSKNIRRFKNDKNIRVIMLSSETCCSGSNLTEASHIVLLDTVNGNKGEANAIEEQAIGRSARLGQTRSVKVIRLIMKDTIENDYYNKNVGDSFKGVETIGTAKQLTDMISEPTSEENIILV